MKPNPKEGRKCIKTVALFITHGGGGLNRMVSDISSLCPGTKVLDRFDATRSGNLASWLESLTTATN